MPLEDINRWGSRKIYLTLLISQFIGISNINSIPNNALIQGATGYTSFLLILYIFVGIPLLYMESVVSQFTARDCIEVWKIRPCFSFIGYIMAVWQAVILIHNHIVASFLIHYFLISFESPIPFYTCGSWSTRYCKSLATNYTVNQDCIKYQNLFPYCDNLYKTFPEYQYWRYYLVNGTEKAGYYVAWRVCVASGLICFVLYLSNFKRTRSIRWVVIVFASYPILSLLVLLTGSMLQKGVVAKYEDALDLDFSDFVTRFRFANVIQQMVYNINIGSGTMFTIASTSAFRSPCFSDVVLAVVVCVLFTTIFIFTAAMMTCPYAYVYGIKPGAIIKTPMSLNFEKMPRLIYQYQYKTFFLILTFSCEAVLGVSTMVIYFFCLSEVVFKRFPKLAKYPGLTTFGGVLCLFVITIPFLSYYGVNILAYSFRRYITLLSIFMALLECLVFIVLYGIHKFSEDVHFMLGIQPKKCMKVAWIVSIVLLAYAFFSELFYQFSNNSGYMHATYILLDVLAFIIVIFIIKLLIAVFRKRFRKFISLDPTWGPKNDVLQRSRAMFSAQAMTKEYIYRQYHLQAGIIARQKIANKRLCYR